MKKLFTVLTVILITATLWAQNPPQKMSYQAVIRDAINHLVTTQVGMQISILQGSESGTAVYVETQTPTPNINGLVTIEIGTGTTTDDFSAINWANGPYYIKTETDPDNSDGLTDYTIFGTSQILSVPYALYAKTVASYSEIDPVFLAHAAYGITSTLIGNWNTAFGWGNHASAGYLTSFTELDPTVTSHFDFTSAATNDLLKFNGTKWVKFTPNYLTGFTETDPNFLAHAAYGITSTLIGNWNTAYGWGDHAAAGYQPLIVSGTTAQFWRGDKTWQTLDKIAIGLGNVDNTTDLLKPVSTATQTALELKAPLASPTFTGTPLAPTATAGTNTTQIATTEFVTSALVAVVPVHYVGELYGGGVVFWADHTGNHGLICSMIDLATDIAWSDVTTTEVPPPGALSDWDGQTNTTAIIAQSIATSAADLCNDYTNADYGTGTYSDWYLPSKGELNDLWNNFKAVQKALDTDGNGTTTLILKDFHWSSSQWGPSLAWTFHTYYGYADAQSKSGEYRVRAVRAF